MASENNNDEESISPSGCSLNIAEKKKLLSQLLQQERDNKLKKKDNIDSPAPSLQENISVAPCAADTHEGEEGGDKSAAQQADDLECTFSRDDVNREHEADQSQRETQAELDTHFSQQSSNNPFQDFLNYVSQSPYHNHFFDQGQSCFANPMEMYIQWMKQFQNSFAGLTGAAQQKPFTAPCQHNASKPMEFYTQWMPQLYQAWLEAMKKPPNTGFKQNNSNRFSDWTQMFQQTFAEQMRYASPNGHHDISQNPFLNLFIGASQAKSGGLEKNAFLDPKTIFTHWSQQIPWEYFWSEIDKNKIFGPNGMFPPDAYGAFSPTANRKEKKQHATYSRKNSPSSPLIRMKETGSRNPFFCVHALLGSSFHFHFLANQMDKEQPFYALQAPGLSADDEGTPIDDIEEFAVLYIQSIRAIQPQGPYHLGGYSFGGWIAYEMARQLLKQGEQVAMIAIFGSSVPFSVLNPSLFEEIRLYDQFMEDYNTTIIHPFLPQEERKPLSYHKNEMNKKLTPLQRVMKAHTNAIISYLPFPCNAKITLFETLDLQLVSPYDSSRGWNRLSTHEVEVHQTPGNHLSMLEEPHIKVLGEKLRFCLRKANGVA